MLCLAASALVLVVHRLDAHRTQAGLFLHILAGSVRAVAEAMRQA